MVLQIKNWRNRPGVLALGLIFCLIVLVQGVVHFQSTAEGRPYEGWDEIATYNTSYVLTGPTSYMRTYRYGTLDTAMQWAAIAYYNRVDPIGRAYPHIRYGNTAPASWEDSLVAYKDKSWPGMDYNYFRGTDDHQPILISRQIHFVFTYALLLATGLTFIALLGLEAVFVLVPLMVLSVAPEMYFQATQSLPNAINTILAFAIVLFAMFYAQGRCRCHLLIAAGLLAIGMNFKPDIIVAAGAIGLALCFVFWKQGWRVALRDALWAAMIGCIALLITDPYLWFDPVMDLRLRYRSILQSAGSSAILADNWRNFRDFLDATFLWRGASTIITPLLVGLALAAPFAILAWQRSAAAFVLSIAASVAIVSWAGIILKALGASDRYFLNGLAAFLAMLAMALVMLAQDGKYRRAAQITAALLAIVWAGHAVAQGGTSINIARQYAQHAGFDPAHNRNLASFAAIELAKKPGFEGEVLVDQHAYIDLRLLRLNGIDAKYINMANFDAKLASLDPAKSHVLIFTRGAYAFGKRFNEEWPDDQQKLYAAYQARLLALPQARQFSGTPQPVSSFAPIERRDDVRVAVIAARAPKN